VEGKARIFWGKVGDREQIMYNSEISDVKFLKIKCFNDNRGNLCPIEFSNLPIEINRIFYVYGVKDRKVRGKHSHYKTNQILICLSGICTVICKDGISEKRYLLDSPEKGLFIPNMIWDEQIYESDDTILLVLSDTVYDKDDYIENWEKYSDIIKERL